MQMWGWFSAEAARASRWNRFKASRSRQTSSERNLSATAAAQPGVLGLIDNPHPAAPELLDDAIVGNGFAQPLLFALGGPAQLRIILRHGFGRHLEGRGLDKARPVLTLRQQRIHLVAQGGIAGTGLVEESGALILRALQRRLTQSLDFPPTIRIHGLPCRRQLGVRRLDAAFKPRGPGLDAALE